MGRGRKDEAAASLAFYNRNPEEVAEEMKAISENLRREKEQMSVHGETWAKKLTRPKFYLPCLYLSTVFSLIEWSCFPVLAFYMIPVLKVINLVSNFDISTNAYDRKIILPDRTFHNFRPPYSRN